MENVQLEYKVLESIINKLGIENLDSDYSKYYDAHLFSSYEGDEVCLGLDSIDALEIIIAIKEDFDVKITDNDTDVLETVSSIANFIKENKNL